MRVKDLKIGVIYPQIEYSTDPGAVREFAVTAEALGFTHILAYDHVLGANPDRPGGWSGPYTHLNTFMEPFVLFSYMAAVTSRIGFTTGILILPQRQTALAAKQAATLDVLSGGRLRLGVAVGWNQVEYEALGENFNRRGAKLEESVTLLRQLWTQPLVTFKGRWHTVSDAGINPLPVQQPIPVWFGGYAEAVLQRTARLGDGWLPNYKTAAEAKPHLDRLAAYASEAGRDPKEIGIEARLSYGSGSPDEWYSLLQGWQEAGATHATLNLMASGFTCTDDYLAAMRRFSEAILQG